MKIPTDEQLAEMGRKQAAAHELNIETWRTAMRTMPLTSTLYRQICSGGRKTQQTYMRLRFEAEERGWNDSQLDDVFYSKTCCSFN